MRALRASLLTLVVACSPAEIGEYPDTKFVPESVDSPEGDASAPPQDPGPQGTVKLTVNLTGVGTGSVMSTPSGLKCQEKTCTGTFKAGATVGLVPLADTGTVFGGWSAGCTGTGTCTVTLNADTTVSAEFGSPAGTYTGNYTHNAVNQGCTFNNQGTLTVTVAAEGTTFSSTGNITGLQLKSVPGCNLVNPAANGTAAKAPVNLAGTTVTGTWAFVVPGVAGSLTLPFEATLSGKTLTGTWKCTGCTGQFAITKP